MSDYGIKVSKEGVSVQGATGDSVLMDTTYKNLKYIKNVYLASAGQFTHGLGYAPVAWTWAKDSQDWWVKTNPGLINVPSTSGGSVVVPTTSSDSTNIYSSAGYCEYLAEKGYIGSSTEKPTGYGVVVSAPGKDVKTAPPYDRIFDSSFNTYKIFASGTVTLSWAEGAEGWISADITHNLGYAPKIIVFGEDGSEPAWTSAGYEGQEVFRYYSNTTKLRVVGQRADFYGGIFGPLPAYSQTFTYFIFVDRIDDSEFI